MSQLLLIKGRTRAITNLRKVTRAMELVTQSRINRIRQNALNAIEYRNMFRRMMATVSAATDTPRFAVGKAPTKVYLVGFLSQKGFCGNFNDKVLGKLFHEIAARDLAATPVELVLIGKRNTKWGYVLRRPFRHYEGKERTYRVELAPLVEEWARAALDGVEFEIHFAYNRLVSILEQKAEVTRVFPFDPEGEGLDCDPITDPDPEEFLNALMPAWFEASLEKHYWESLAGEYCARLISMKNANENATLIIDHLQLLYNKTRQMKITQELSEIVSAFDVLKHMQEKKDRNEV